jgi:hypothetical protein
MPTEDFERWEAERRARQARHEQRRAERLRERENEPEAPAGPERAEVPPSRKERVLHTRVSDSLDRAIRRAAEDMRVPVSNLVRNVLEDVFEVVERVTDNVGGLVEDVLDEVDGARDRISRDRRREARRRDDRRQTRQAGETPAEPPAEAPTAPESAREEFPDVLGWQPLILNSAQRCADCGRDLLRGDKGFVGLAAQGLSPHYLCDDCAAARS